MILVTLFFTPISTGLFAFEGKVFSVEGSTSGNIAVTYRYDEPESTGEQGRATSITDETGSVRYHYDGISGQVTRQESAYKFEYRSTWTGNKVTYLDTQFDIESVYDPGVGISGIFTGLGSATVMAYKSIEARNDQEAGGETEKRKEGGEASLEGAKKLSVSQNNFWIDFSTNVRIH